jgi:hypothetical protein
VRITFVGTGPYLRLPEVLARPGVHITVVGNARHPLRRSRFVDRFIELDYDEEAQLAEALVARPDVVAELDEWVIVGSDPVLRSLAISALPESDKLRILPVRAAAGLSLLGSKVGLHELSQRAGVDSPRTVVVTSAAGLAAAAEQVAGPGGAVVIKADEGWGGDYVRRWPAQPGEDDQIPAFWFPVVVQEYLAGQEADVGTLFREGRLVGWTYCHVTASTSVFGPSTLRQHRSPPSLDFVRDLDRLGEVGGLHGFFNCSLIWSPDKRRHYLFELDGRPNAWVQFGPALGVDWVRQMTAVEPGVATQQLAPGERRAIGLYPRAVISGLERMDWSAIRPWFLALPGTWDTRNRRDRAVNALERADTVRALRHWAAMAALIGVTRVRQAVLPRPVDPVHRRGARPES